MGNTSVNIVLCGVGGQGINGVTRQLHVHCVNQGWHCVSAVYKGGAQRLGSVRAEIRLFPPGSDAVELKSSQILPGTLHALIVMEQWEGLRYLSLCNPSTWMLMDEFVEFPPGNRDPQQNEYNPNKIWEHLNNPKITKDYKALAIVEWGHARFTAIAMLNEYFEAAKLPLEKMKNNK